MAAVAFLDAFQKVADMATNSRGKALVFNSQPSALRMVSLGFTFVSQSMIADPSEVFCKCLTFPMSLRTHFPVLTPHCCHSLKDAETRAQLARDVLKYSQDLSMRTGLHVSQLSPPVVVV